MEFWDPKLAGLFAHTSLTTGTQAEQGFLRLQVRRLSLS
jgi:hypothetical protein